MRLLGFCSQVEGERKLGGKKELALIEKQNAA